jgi:hypothetical protein
LAAKIRTLSATITISGSLVRLATKIRALTGTITIADAVTAVKAGVHNIVKTLSETVLISASIRAFKNGIELLPIIPSGKGGHTIPYKKPPMPRLKQVLYPVYTVERQQLERRRKLREYPPLVIIPAFKYNINKTIAPFVITDPIRNEVRVRFAINDQRHITFVGKAVPIAITPSSQQQKVNKARCAHVMNQKAIEKYGKRLNKLHKLMALWSMVKQLEPF